MKKKKLLSFRKKVMQNPVLLRVLKVLASVFVLYHLMVMVIVPHPSSLLYKTFSPYLMFYAGTLNMAGSWDLFSHPGSYIYFEYEVRGQKTKKTRRKKRRVKTSKTFIWPPSRKESDRLYFNHNRLIFHTRYFYQTRSPALLRRHVLPFLCQLHPQAKSLSLKAFSMPQTPYRKARSHRNYSFDFRVHRTGKKQAHLEFEVKALCANRDHIRSIDSEEEYEDFQIRGGVASYNKQHARKVP